MLLVEDDPNDVELIQLAIRDLQDIRTLDVLHDEPTRRTRLAELARRLRTGVRQRGWTVADDPTPIVPLIVGDADVAMKLSDRLLTAGFLVPAIRPPTVAPGSSRLRVTLRCDLTDDDIDRLIEAIGTPVASE